MQASKLHLGGSLRDYRVVYAWTCIIAVLQTCWAVAFIWRSSFQVEGKRYFCLFDDAMISMCYARNWATGHGLVWNLNEHVEGYTNFLWTLLLGLCHLPRLSPEHTCLLVQLLGIPICWLCLVATVRLARSCRLIVPTALAAVLLVGTFYNLLYFTLLGMETGLVAAMVTLAVAAACESYRAGRIAARTVLWFAPILLMRPDALPLAMLVAGFVLVTGRRGRLRFTAAGVAVAAALCAHLLWRHYFYGDWLPNTYYLKATNWPLLSRLHAGFRHTFYSAIQLGVPCLMAIIALLEFRARHLLLAGLFVVAVANQVYVGGDAWPLSRFLLPALPAVSILAAIGIYRLACAFARGRRARIAAMFVLTVVCAGFMNVNQWRYLLLLQAPQLTQANRCNIQYVHAINHIATCDATVAVGYAGAFPYFSQRICFDLLGKCDPVIAREPINPLLPSRPGHNKLDLAYTIRAHQPDIILHGYWKDRTFLDSYRPTTAICDEAHLVLAVRRDSQRIHGGDGTTWNQLIKQLVDTLRED